MGGDGDGSYMSFCASIEAVSYIWSLEGLPVSCDCTWHCDDLCEMSPVSKQFHQEYNDKQKTHLFCDHF